MTPREQLEEVAREIGRKISSGLKPRVGFGLLIFNFGEEGDLAWITNADASDMVKALRETADKVEAKIQPKE